MNVTFVPLSESQQSVDCIGGTNWRSITADCPDEGESCVLCVTESRVRVRLKFLLNAMNFFSLKLSMKDTCDGLWLLVEKLGEPDVRANPNELFVCCWRES